MSWGSSGSGGSLQKSERDRLRTIVLARDRGVCQLAIQGVCTHRATSVDHIAPREVAGDGVDNLQAACMPCNQRKGDPRRRDPEVKTASWL